MATHSGYLAGCEAELVASLVCYPEMWGDVPAMEPDYFSVPVCREAYAVIHAFAEAGTPWSPGIVREALGSEHRVQLWEMLRASIEHDASVKAAAHHVREAWVVRQVQAAGMVMAQAWTPGMCASDVLAPTEETINALRALSVQQGACSIKTAIIGIIKTLQEGRARNGIMSGLPTFDRNTGGFFAGCLYVIGARPSTGKTAFAVTVAVHAADDRVPVLIVSTETTAASVTARITAHVGHLDAFDIRTGRVNHAQFGSAAAKVPSNIHIIDGNPRIDHIVNEVRAWRKKHPGRCIVMVDYLELVQPSRSKQSREQEVSDIVVALQSLAKDADMPIMVLSQLSRPQKTAKPAPPTMSSLRYSGMIEQAADVVGLMYREEDDAGETQRIRIRVDKNRVGGVEFTIDAVVNRPESRVSEIVTEGHW